MWPRFRSGSSTNATMRSGGAHAHQIAGKVSNRVASQKLGNTRYPAGHYPYGRVAVVPYSASGKLLLDADSGRPPWQATLFGAAQDAAQGQIWPSEQSWWQRRDPRRRRTQGRRLEMGGRLTGVSGGLDEREREKIATRLGVATMTVISGARRWGAQLAGPRCSDRGGAGGAGLQRHAGGPHGCRWCGQRSVGATAPAAGGALGAGRQELDGGRDRRFRSAGTGRRRQPSGTGTASHESARSSRLGRFITSPVTGVGYRAAALLGGRRGGGPGAARMVRGSRGTPRCRRRPCRSGRSPGADQRAYPATLARGLGHRQARRPGAAAAHPHHDLTGTEPEAGRLPAHREAA